MRQTHLTIYDVMRGTLPPLPGDTQRMQEVR